MGSFKKVSTAPQLVWERHGAPLVDACSDVGSGRCYVCGGTVARGMPVGKWMGGNYTDQTVVRAPLATHTCEACVYVMSRTTPVLGRPPKDGKKFGGCFRNYSHAFEGGEYFNASKGEKSLIRDFLRRDHKNPWFCAIADSGQKHVLPYAPMNGAGRGGRVLFDEALVRVPVDLALLDAVIDALTWGITKNELGSGQYRVWSWQTVPEQVRAFESAHGAERGSEWFSLAIWLGQRDEEKYAERQAAKTAGDDVGRDRRFVKGRVSKRAKWAPTNELLGADRAANEGGSDYNCQRKRMGELDAKGAADPQSPRQLGLFGP